MKKEKNRPDREDTAKKKGDPAALQPPAGLPEEEAYDGEYFDGEYEEEYDPADDVRVCPRCGKLLIPGKPFCPNCGNLVDIVPESNPTRGEFRAARSAKTRRAAAVIG
ncbi:MAG: zinc-ribbon domain-containing protein, partial [Clostridia bacterium]|nr:zinc-ribbon domain-containing protein [Clostridia bacterium]